MWSRRNLVCRQKQGTVSDGSGSSNWKIQTGAMSISYGGVTVSSWRVGQAKTADLRAPKRSPAQLRVNERMGVSDPKLSVGISRLEQYSDTITVWIGRPGTKDTMYSTSPS